MGFSLYTLLTKDSLHVSNDSLAKQLKDLFSGWDEFTCQIEKLPFARYETLALYWGKWLIRVCYEVGDDVVKDSRKIQEITGDLAPFDISNISRRIRVVFGDDYDDQYTEQMVSMIDFLLKIDGALVYDPQQNDFVK